MNLQMLYTMSMELLDRGVPPLTPVDVEGCDCFGEGWDVQTRTTHEDELRVIVTRTDGVFRDATA